MSQVIMYRKNTIDDMLSIVGMKDNDVCLLSSGDTYIYDLENKNKNDSLSIFNGWKLNGIIKLSSIYDLYKLSEVSDNDCIVIDKNITNLFIKNKNLSTSYNGYTTNTKYNVNISEGVIFKKQNIKYLKPLHGNLQKIFSGGKISLHGNQKLEVTLPTNNYIRYYKDNILVEDTSGKTFLTLENGEFYSLYAFVDKPSISDLELLNNYEEKVFASLNPNDPFAYNDFKNTTCVSMIPMCEVGDKKKDYISETIFTIYMYEPNCDVQQQNKSLQKANFNIVNNFIGAYAPGIKYENIAKYGAYSDSNGIRYEDNKLLNKVFNGQMLYFDGSGQYIDSGVSPSSSQQKTIRVTVKDLNINVEENSIIFGSGYSGTAATGSLSLCFVKKSIKATLEIDGTDYNAVYDLGKDSYSGSITGEIDLDVGYVKLYLNGIEVVKTTFDPINDFTAASGYNYVVGLGGNSSGRREYGYVTGMIGNCIVYDRILGNEKVLALHNEPELEALDFNYEYKLPLIEGIGDPKGYTKYFKNYDEFKTVIHNFTNIDNSWLLAKNIEFGLQKYKFEETRYLTTRMYIPEIILNYIIDSGEKEDYIFKYEAPSYDENNPSHALISGINDLNKLNDENIFHFYLKPKDYRKDLPLLSLTKSGNKDQYRTLTLLNGDNKHPYNNNLSQLAIFNKIEIKSDYWYLDRIAVVSPINTTLNMERQIIIKGSNNVFNRLWLKDFNQGIGLLTDSNDNVIQNSVIEEQTLYGRKHDGVGIAIITDHSSDYVVCKNNKFVNNDIINCSDGIQLVRHNSLSVSGRLHEANYEGTIISGNHIYITNSLYTDGKGNLTYDGVYSYSENPIDVKVGSSNKFNKVIIKNNIMGGYRKSDNTDSYVDDPGAIMPVHYGVTNLIFDNNTTFDSNKGLSIGAENSFGLSGGNIDITNNLFVGCDYKEIPDGHYYMAIVGRNTGKINISGNKFTSTIPYGGRLDSVGYFYLTQKDIIYEDNVILGESFSIYEATYQPKDGYLKANNNTILAVDATISKFETIDNNLKVISSFRECLFKDLNLQLGRNFNNKNNIKIKCGDTSITTFSKLYNDEYEQKAIFNRHIKIVSNHEYIKQ